MKSYTYRIIIEPDGEAYHAYVPSLPGCHTYGASVEEARMNLREAIELYITQLQSKKTDIPEEHGLESFETIAI